MGYPKNRDWWIPEDGGNAPLPADKGQGAYVDVYDSRESSPRFLNCERCDRPAVATSEDARIRTSGWRLPLYCDDCESWWARMLE